MSRNLAYPLYPPPPVSKNHLAQEPTPGSAVKFSHHFFYQGSGFFMFLVDVGQLFRCAGHHFMCVTTGPPIRGDPISHSQAHIPLITPPPCSRPLPRSNQPLTRNKQTSVKQHYDVRRKLRCVAYADKHGPLVFICQRG